MSKASPIQYAFNGGQLGPRLQGRSDLARYATGCNTLRNFIPTYQGPAIKRSGFRHVKPVKDASEKVRVIPFEFSTDDAYVLELGEGYIRVYKDSGTVLESAISITGVTAANPVVVTATSSYSAGDQVYVTGSAQTELNGRYFTVANPTGSNFELQGEDGTGRSTGSGGTVARVYEIVDGVSSNDIPWLETELQAIQFAQVADVVYLVHGSHPPHKIERTSDTSWTCTVMNFDWPAFREENSDTDLLMVCSDHTGDSRTVTMRGKTDDGISASTSNATPVVVTTGSNHGYATGDTVYLFGLSGATSLNDTHYVITVLTATTFELDGTTAPGSTGSGGTVEKLPSTAFQFTSDMVGSHVKIRALTGQDVGQWRADIGPTTMDNRVTSFVAGFPGYYEQNVYVLDSGSAASGTGNLPPLHDSPADGPISDGTLDWDWYNRFAGYATITAVASDGYSCTVNVQVGMPYAHALSNPMETADPASWDQWSTFRWSIGGWSAEYGYPRAVAFYEDRLWLGGTTKDPQTFWGSRTGDYENFEIIDDEDTSSVVFTLASDKINTIEWMSGEDVLLIGTRGGEFTADAGSADEAITPSNIRVRRRSNYGSYAGVAPLFVDSALLFAHRNGRRLHELTYFFDTQSYTAPDLTQMSYDILSSGVVDMAYQSAPFRIVWVVLTDGTLASLTYIRDEDVLAWAKHEIGGTSAKVESIAVIPHPDGDEDQVWVVTSRTVNGGTVRDIEFLEKPFAEDAEKADAFFVDAGLTYDGSAATTITGLYHLEGETVSVLADGAVVDDQTVSGGSITLSAAAEKVHVGLAIPEARLQTMRIEAGAPDGTAMGKRKRIPRVVVRLNDAGDGIRYGSNFDTMDEWFMRDTSDAMDTPVPLYTGDTPSLSMPSGWEQEGRLAIAHDLPLPCTIVAVMPEIVVEKL